MGPGVRVNRLLLVGLVVTTVVAVAGGAVLLTGGNAEAAAPCGSWTRTASDNPAFDGMQIRLTGGRGIVVDPAESRFPRGTELWRDVVENESGGELRVLGSDDSYYDASFSRPDETTLLLTIAASGAGTEQTWSSDSSLGCPDLALADVACGAWSRTSSTNPAADGMQVRLLGPNGVVTDPAGSAYALGDELWRSLTPVGDGASLEVLGSDRAYYPGVLVAIDGDTLLLEIASSGAGTEQTWERVDRFGCDDTGDDSVPCGVWRRSASTNSALDGTEVRVTGPDAVVTSAPGGSWLHEGDVLWRDVVAANGGALTLDVLGSDGRYHAATLLVLDTDQLRVEIASSGAGAEQTWVRVAELGCGGAAEIACGTWERSASSNPGNDGIRVRITGTVAVVTDAAASAFPVDTVLWRGIEPQGDSLRLEVRATDGSYYPASLVATGLDMLRLDIDASGSGNDQTWTEVDASGCVVDLGPPGPVCGTWVRTTSTNPANDGMTVVADGSGAVVAEPAGSRYGVGAVLWRYIDTAADPATLEVLASDGRHYAAEFVRVGPDRVDVEILASGAGREQTWERTDRTGCGEAVGEPQPVDVCGTWERTESTNPASDGMRVVGAGDRALVVDPAGSAFAAGDVLWRDIRSTDAGVTLEARATDGTYFAARLTASGFDELALAIDATGSGTDQRWQRVDLTGCGQPGPTDVVCGEWVRTASDNPRLDGMTVAVSAGRGVITALPEGSTGFVVGDEVWTSIRPAAGGWTLDVLATDGARYPARVLVTGAETASLVIDASGAGNEQTWMLSTPGACDVPELTTCGTWTRVASDDPRLDGTVVRVEGDTASIIELPDGADEFGVGDVVWRGLRATPTGVLLDVLGSDGTFHDGLLTARGVDLLELHVETDGPDGTQTWVETMTDGCDDVGADGGPTAGPGSGTSSGSVPDDTPENGADDEPVDETAPPEETDGADCVPGTWLLDSQAFVEALAVSGGGLAQGGEVRHVSGTYDLTIRPDGSFIQRRKAWTLIITTADGGLQAVFDGEQSGTMVWDETTITATITSNTTTMEMSLIVDGQLVPFPGGMNVDTDTVGGAARYTCTSDLLQLDVDGGDAQVPARWNRSG